VRRAHAAAGKGGLCAVFPDVDKHGRLGRVSALLFSQGGSVMEAKEEAQIQALIDTDPELRRYYEEHVELKQQLEELRQKSHLTEDEEVEQKRIQKQKLAGKDRMMEILARHQRQDAA
jgi:uncharacterized protein YdcH (DUF465 family)